MTGISTARPSVVVLGGGYGGINVAKALDEVAEVSLVDPAEAFFHNIAALRALADPQWLEQIFFPYQRLLSAGRFVRDRAVSVAGRQVTLESGEVLQPDYLVLATGSCYPFPGKAEERDVARVREWYRGAHEALASAERALILGAGPVGLELAGEIKAFFPGTQVTVADVADDILAGHYPQKLRDELRGQLGELGIQLRLGITPAAPPSVPPATRGQVRLSTGDGGELAADIWFPAFGVRPNTGYLDGASLASGRGRPGCVRVDEHLRVLGETRVFALGDIADADRNMAGIAGHQAGLIAANIAALITGEGELTRWVKFPPVFVISLGPRNGAGFVDGSILGPAAVAEIKGRDMFAASFAALFDATRGSGGRPANGDQAHEMARYDASGEQPEGS
jgi:NADH dehydrogenase FAD-containing subunit